ncbi:MAG: enoyl-CoA hydratase/isomerase family protein [Alphaproteobacteria bacterium]
MRTEITGGIATLSFTSPATFNALDGAKTKLFREALDKALGDSTVRVVVLRGDGPAFGAGGDLSMFEPMEQAPDILRALGRDLNSAIERLRTTDAVVIASVHGSVAGGSIGLMLAADMVIAAEGTRFNFAYMKIGGCPDAGNSVFLPRIVGDRKAFELIALSETFDAAEALRLGLVNRIVPLDQLEAETRKLAARFMSGPAASFAATKHLLRQSATAPLRQHLDNEIETFARVSSTADFVEGVTAFRAKRVPKFGQGSRQG